MAGIDNRMEVQSSIEGPHGVPGEQGDLVPLVQFTQAVVGPYMEDIYNKMEVQTSIEVPTMRLYIIKWRYRQVLRALMESLVNRLTWFLWFSPPTLW